MVVNHPHVSLCLYITFTLLRCFDELVVMEILMTLENGRRCRLVRGIRLQRDGEGGLASRRRRRRGRSCVGRRIKALRKLVPCGETMEVGRLFMEAANYISCLQMQAKAMQVMVRVLAGDGAE